MFRNTEIEEISNNVYRLKMIHTSGASIEKTGTDIESMKEQAKLDSNIMEKEIKNLNDQN